MFTMMNNYSYLYPFFKNTKKMSSNTQTRSNSVDTRHTKMNALTQEMMNDLNVDMLLRMHQGMIGTQQLVGRVFRGEHQPFIFEDIEQRNKT